MLNKKIIAASVCNLTDARYFSGWMVDYIHFDLRGDVESGLTMSSIGEMQSWIEGPEFIVSSDLDIMKKMMIDVSAGHAMLFNCTTPLDFPCFYHVQQHFLKENIIELKGKRIILSSIEDIEKVEIMVNNYELEVYLDTRFIQDYYIGANWLTGYMVHGSPEEKVGFKSYDDVDDLFEQLED